MFLDAVRLNVKMEKVNSFLNHLEASLIFVIAFGVLPLPADLPIHSIRQLRPIQHKQTFQEYLPDTDYLRDLPDIENLRELPDIHKDNGNVFKPKPLQPGPWVTMTKGEIWPKPKYQQKNSTFLVLDVNKFRINVSKIN